jgi:hypothetical protein
MKIQLLINDVRFRPFYGLYMDIRTKLPFYISDWTDCASLQCLAATLYLYLVCLCSVVAFGGMLGAATENYMVRIMQEIFCGMFIENSYLINSN